MGPVLPITQWEFLHMLQRCVPPSGWPSKLAVAFSGGADSTCLLFLFQRMAQSQSLDTSSKPLPRTILALNVNHSLQEASNDMGLSARKSAKSLGAEVHEYSVPWSQPPFPPRPEPGEAVEGVARHARYRMLFKAMMDLGSDVIAFGHHADDQVETALMRLAKGSTSLGLAGMRPIRRWGMGFGMDDTSIGYFGHEGMHRWIVRPLLLVSKDRILATCEAHKLEYVTDQTNFEPDLTMRNAIRHLLARPDPTVSGLPAIPQNLVEKFDRITTASEDMNLPAPLDITSSTEDVRGVVQWAAENLEDIENEASICLRQHSVQSPPSTFLLASDKIAGVSDPMIRVAMVMRILRFVSPAPWGSVASQAGRRSDSISRIIDRIWNPDPFAPDRLAFEGGGRVLWSPIRIASNGRLKYMVPKSTERFGWIASRAPTERGRIASTNMDITGLLVGSLQKDGHLDKKTVEVFYDNRFLLTLWLRSMPEELAKSLLEGGARVAVVPDTKWIWPKVVWQRPDTEDVVLACISSPEMRWYQRLGVDEENPPDPPLWDRGVDIRFIRALDEI